MVHDSDTDIERWAEQQVLRVESLSKQQVLLELLGIMEGYSYSWHCINEFLQARFDEGSLERSPVDGDVLFEWNNLCDEKRTWEENGCLSVNDAGFNIDCLINLMILPVQAGLGNEVLRLVTSNRDKPGASIAVLGVGLKDSDHLRSRAASWFMTESDTSSLESDDSEYVDDQEETDDEGSEHVGVENLCGGESDEARNEDEVMGIGYGNISEKGSDEEENEDSGDSSLTSEVESDDEDIGSLGVRIVDIDDNDDVSDFLL
ncbi:hypothetical protein IFR04_014376 [Cadophora malorum]|uniref:Uncharacterized protein n=1 Tax=Cadophora malorum TaxID=108018 RepID=A0A8H7W297_9HELO|nr:hypothetical protein IFR04_014376 [Cadophora malorum]